MYKSIKSLCEERGITIKELERIAGLGNGTIGKWQTSQPNLESLKKICEALDISLMELLQGGVKDDEVH